jgi:hypothetical protein
MRLILTETTGNVTSVGLASVDPQREQAEPLVFHPSEPLSIWTLQEPPVSRPSFEPARERHVNLGTSPRDGLFSHPPEAALFEEHRPLVGDGVDWQAIPVSDRVAEQRRTGRPRLTHGPRRHPPAAPE